MSDAENQSAPVSLPSAAGDPGPTPVAAATQPDSDDFVGSPAAQPEPKRRNPALRAITVVAIVVAVAIAGTVTVWALERPGVLPENVLPAEGAATFVRLDYDPALTQSFTAYRFNDAYQAAADQTPSRADLSAGPLGWLFGPMLEGTGMTVRSDVDGWVGDKAGVMVLDSGTVLVAVKVDGDVAGKEAQIREFFVEYARTAGVTVGYAFSRGYLVISDSSADAEQATRLAAQGGDLAGDPGYVADLRRLPSARLGVAWTKLGPLPQRRADSTFSGRVMTTLDREVGGPAGLVRGVLTAGALPDQVYSEAATAAVEGRLVLGLTMRPDGIAVDGFISDLSVNGTLVGDAPADGSAAVLAETSAAPVGPQGLFELRAVPADTVLAAGVKGLGGVLRVLTDAPLSDTPATDTPVTDTPVTEPAPADPAATDPAATDPAAEAPDPDPASAVDTASPLVGTDTAIGVLGGGGIVVRAAGTDPAAVAEAVTEATGSEPVAVVAEQSASGTTSLITTGEVVDQTPLDNIPTFTDALPSLDEAVAAFYVNLDWATFTQDVDSLGPYSSFGIGVSKGTEPGGFDLHGRLLIDELYAAPKDVPDVLPSGAASGNPSAETSDVAPSSAASSSGAASVAPS